MNDDCSQISRELSAFHDGELYGPVRAGVEAHLAACGACSEELRGLASLDAGLKRLPAAEPSPFFAARVAASARSLNVYHGPFRRFLLFPVPVAAALTAFLIFNIFSFAFNVNAMESGPRRELARKVVAQLAKPASMINPLALARLCGECNKYMCLCMHEAGKKSICPCKNCEMGKIQEQAEPGKPASMGDMGEKDVH